MGQRTSYPGCYPKNFNFHKPLLMFFNLATDEYGLDCDCHMQFACPNGEPSMPPHLGEFINEPIPQEAYAQCPELRISPTLPLRESWEIESPDIWSDWRDNHYP
ncbi:hypothetical protein HRG_010608 [Hirsutella rhossiliensis]|uniref:Uncharacterized protein n=1 Tax=Hirsutella rhossiliensis TaxID=111463 RepID=A0A9P8MN21_9HYPO|nr:uncharacterized protein HRG_10608 [Hirsutella rhossiliensis]KAH0958307.1 hypothetical protein HRG_10608 [Hirsutella rhossiliensis]